MASEPTVAVVDLPASEDEIDLDSKSIDPDSDFAENPSIQKKCQICGSKKAFVSKFIRS